MVFHKDLTGANLHEPKGIENANSGDIYIADGAGSGVWQSIDIPTGLFTCTIASFTSSGTWTKPNGLFLAKVYAIGSGGGQGGFGTIGGSVSFGSHCSATGGFANVSGPSPAGGTATGGDLNLNGSRGQGLSFPVTGNAGSPGYIFGIYGHGLVAATSNGGEAGNSGGGGGCAIKYIEAADLGATETVTIDSGGANNGIVVVEQYILI